MQREPLASKAAWSALAAALNIGGKLIGSILAVRVLGPSEGGRLLLVVWLSEVLVTAAGLGLPQAVTRSIAADEANTATWAMRRFLVPVGLAASAALWWQGGAFGFAFAAQALAGFYLAWLAGRQLFRRAATMNALSGVVVAAGVPLLASYSGVTGALLAYGAASIVPAACALRLFSRGAGGASGVWRYAAATWAAALLSMVAWSRSELFFLERFSGNEAVAFFGAGLTLASLATQAPLLFCGALLPHFAELHGRAQTETLRAAYRDATLLLALFAMPAAALASALSPVLLPLLYGPAFAPAVPAAAVVVAGAGVAFANAGSAYVYGVGKSAFIAFSAGLGAIAATGALLYAVPQWGLVGAAWARVAVQWFLAAFGAWYIHSRLRTPVPVRELLSIAGLAAVAGLVAFAIVSHLPGLTGALLAALAFAAAYATGVCGAGLVPRFITPLAAARTVEETS